MTQPTQAVGGEATPVDARTDALNTFEDIASEMLGEQDEEEEQPEAEAEAPEAEAEDEPELDEADIEAEDIESLPPIDAPVSWTAEEKEEFAALPRALQETLSRREGEREKFVQTKAQEAARERTNAMREAAEYVATLQSETAAQLEQYAQQFTVPEPDPALIATDPVAYAQQVRAHQYYSAQRAEAQRQAEGAKAQAQQYQALLQQHEQETFRQRLGEALPDFFDETNGPKLRNELTATAKSLGFSDEAIFNANADQIVALKAVSDLKAKADKFDKLMAKQMERVRAGKQLPPVSKPGVAKGPDQNRQARADQAWQQAKSAKSRPAKDEALAAWMENTGWL